MPKRRPFTPKRRKPIVPKHVAFAQQEAANRRTLDKLKAAGAGESVFDLLDRDGDA